MSSNNSSPVKIAKMCISIGDLDLTLTPSEAKDLYAVLHELYGEKERIVYRDGYWYRNTFPPTTWYGNISLTSDKYLANQMAGVIDLRSKEPTFDFNNFLEVHGAKLKAVSDNNELINL